VYLEVLVVDGVGVVDSALTLLDFVLFERILLTQFVYALDDVFQVLDGLLPVAADGEHVLLDLLVLELELLPISELVDLLEELVLILEGQIQVGHPGDHQEAEQVLEGLVVRTLQPVDQLLALLHVFVQDECDDVVRQFVGRLAALHLVETRLSVPREALADLLDLLSLINCCVPGFDRSRGRIVINNVWYISSVSGCMVVQMVR